MSSAIHSGLNVVLRMPVLYASMHGALLAGEIVTRIMLVALNCLDFSGDGGLAKWVSDRTSDWLLDMIRPYRRVTNEGLVIGVVVCCVIGTLGSELISNRFGNPPPIYNQVLSFLGPIRVANDRHPFLEAFRFR